MNIYAVITEIPTPYCKNDVWMLNMKVVDDSLNQRATMQIEDETRKLMAGNPP